MLTMKTKSAGAAVRAIPAGMPLSAMPMTTRDARVRSAPVKPMGVAPTLHAPAQKTLAAKAAQQASQQAGRLARRDRVVLEHLPLVKAIAVRVHENLPVHVDLDDLVHAGILGLFDAANKYNPEKQVVFSSYAKHRIKGAILDSLRQLDWASRDMRRRHKQVEAATRDLAAHVAARSHRIRSRREAGHGRRALAHHDAGSAQRRPDLGLHALERKRRSARSRFSQQAPRRSPIRSAPASSSAALLGVAMKTLPERYRKVVLLYYTNEMTMKEIGGVLGINESRVSQIHKSALEKMQAALQASGITSSQAF